MTEEAAPQGYKLTEVGVIPEDWSVAPLGECLTGSPRYGINAPAVPYNPELPTYIRITDITEEGRFSRQNRASVDSDISGTYTLSPGDLVFARTGASVGKSYLHRRENGTPVFAGFLIRVRPDEQKLDSVFLSNYVTTSRYWSWIKMMSARSGQPGVNGEEYGQLPVPLPPLREQRAIAAALVGVDNLISSLASLISKKRDVKTAAMQQLLTGKRRLPGFSGTWETKRLGDAGKCLRGVSYNGSADLSPHETERTVRLLRANNVQDESIVATDLQFVDSARVSDKQRVQPDDIIVCMANGSKRLVGKSALFRLRDESSYTFGAFMGCLRIESTRANPAFVSFLLQTRRYRRFINDYLAGSSINNLKPSDIESIEFKMPPLEEQTAIVTVLSDMDAEIEALEARREKTHRIKQGMMQELLTGRTRLVPAGA